MPSDGLIRVVLLGLPVPLHRRTTEHIDDLRREFELIRLTECGAHARSVPNRLHQLIESVEPAFAGMTDEPNAQLQEAIARARDVITLVYMVPTAAAEAARLLGEMLDEADAYCHAGEHLLTLATPTDVLRYRRWFLGEFVAQIDGAAPTSWAEYAAGRSPAPRTAETGTAEHGRGPT